LVGPVPAEGFSCEGSFWPLEPPELNPCDERKIKAQDGVISTGEDMKGCRDPWFHKMFSAHCSALKAGRDQFPGQQAILFKQNTFSLIEVRLGYS